LREEEPERLWERDGSEERDYETEGEEKRYVSFLLSQWAPS
jgi:hypothetical protein